MLQRPPRQQLRRGRRCHNGGSQWHTVAHSAAEFDDVTTMRRLVAEGADVNVQDAGGTRPLHVAVSNGHVEALKTLVELGADKEAP